MFINRSRKGRFLFYFAENAPVVFDQLVERKIMTIVRDYRNYPPAPAASEILSRTRHTPQAYPTAPRVTITHQSNKSKTDCMNKDQTVETLLCFHKLYSCSSTYRHRGSSVHSSHTQENLHLGNL